MLQYACQPLTVPLVLVHCLEGSCQLQAPETNTERVLVCMNMCAPGDELRPGGVGRSNFCHHGSLHHLRLERIVVGDDVRPVRPAQRMAACFCSRLWHAWHESSTQWRLFLIKRSNAGCSMLLQSARRSVAAASATERTSEARPPFTTKQNPRSPSPGQPTGRCRRQRQWRRQRHRWRCTSAC